MDHTETVPETLGRLAEAVTESAVLVRGSADPELERVAARLDAVLAAFAKTRRALAARPASPMDATTRWLHDLRAATTAVCGWISMLRQPDGGTARRHALDAVERNAASIEALLAATPPTG
jgi:hypothetical protein